MSINFSSLAMGSELATTLTAILKSLADPLRLRMISAISADPRGESCVCDLVDLGDVSQPTVSHHLKVLKDTGLLESERRGTWVWYRINPARRSAVTALLEGFAPASVATSEKVGTAQTSTAQAQLAAMDARITRLGEEIAGEFPNMSRELVVAIVRESYAALVRSAKTAKHLALLTERFARQRLADLARTRGTGAPQVLFVCVANAGRSQLAAALMNEISGGKVVARSAGSQPATDVNPHVKTIVAGLGSTNSAEIFPKPLTDDAVRAADVVVTMGCGDVCPIIPGVQYEDWAVGDPALASAEGVAAIRDDIEQRVTALVDTLLPATESEKP